MPSLFDVVGGVFIVRLTMIDLDKRVMFLDVEQDGQVLAETTEGLDFRPEWWHVGGRYELSELDLQAAERAREAVRRAQQVVA